MNRLTFRKVSRRPSLIEFREPIAKDRVKLIEGGAAERLVSCIFDLGVGNQGSGVLDQPFFEDGGGADLVELTLGEENWNFPGKLFEARRQIFCRIPQSESPSDGDAAMVKGREIVGRSTAGFIGAIFTADSRADRKIGVVMVLTGVLWLEAMHWWELTPTYPGEVNRYWLIFWPTMLLGVLAFAAGAAALVGLVGENRQQEQRLISPG